MKLIIATVVALVANVANVANAHQADYHHVHPKTPYIGGSMKAGSGNPALTRELVRPYTGGSMRDSRNDAVTTERKVYGARTGLWYGVMDEKNW